MGRRKILRWWGSWGSLGKCFAKIPADPCTSSRFHVEMGGGGMPRDALDIKCSVDGLLLLPQMAVLAAASLNYSKSKSH